MQSIKLQTGSRQTPRIITARSYGRFRRQTQFSKGYTALEDGRV